MSITRCKQCNRPLALNRYAYASREGMFCSYDCALSQALSLYKEDEYETAEELVEKAKAYVDDITEKISREDYGVEEKYRYVYVEDEDMTFVFKDVVENDCTISTKLLGFNFGEPEEGMSHKLKAEFVF